MSKDSFRAFVRSNPNFIYSVKNKKVTWQELYELYDLYGEDRSVFSKYLEESGSSSNGNRSSGGGSSRSAFSDISNMIKEMDVDKVQNGVTSLQKALSLFSELFASKEGGSNAGNIYEPRAVYKRFED